MKGWFGDKFKHSLASKGISARQIKDIYNFPTTINYDDPEEFISAFWIASLKNDFSDFDFEKIFDFTKEVLKPRLNRYGYLSFEEFYNDPESYGNINVIAEEYIDEKDWFREKYSEAFYNGFFSDELHKEYAKDVYNTINVERSLSLAGLDPEYDKLFKTYKELENSPNTLREKIILMDKLVDLQHHRYSIWMDKYYDDYLDIEKLRDEFEKKYRLIR